ncbi:MULTISPECIES: imidazole glycerol phosphate synthase subunit HisF [unclassified Clostridium]|uniref:imidazole glycerol phosphate synthase subunit HisF n=1 Tax=unclassified Clostridium TaxID=2614128 RepID=UPI000298273F|nr:MULTISPECIES: imidazole glycerol phosphate synthase subunit HisF [unclassified Clostridium]EKQ51124.1 MAG: imidazoleglycerol phosphate synthase, cyclase subunit [Clostridium sp. Maddingley MBC34-26]
MKNIRVIARLDVKNDYLVKGINLEGLRKIGDPNEFAKIYYEQGADEIIYMDIVASLYNRNNLTDIIRKTTEDIFIPITVGGGIRSIEDVQKILKSGADKVAINTAAIKRPELISEISNKFGSQCMVLSIEAKKISDGKWEAYYDNGREKTGIDVIEWAKKGYELGAGEILLTSVDMEGTKKGFDYELIKTVVEVVPIPVIASGGMGKSDDMKKAITDSMADAVAIASVLHYKKTDIQTLKEDAIKAGINVRRK